jgi:hypothetical protein
VRGRGRHVLPDGPSGDHDADIGHLFGHERRRHVEGLEPLVDGEPAEEEDGGAILDGAVFPPGPEDVEGAQMDGADPVRRDPVRLREVALEDPAVEEKTIRLRVREPSGKPLPPARLARVGLRIVDAGMSGIPRAAPSAIGSLGDTSASST